MYIYVCVYVYMYIYIHTYVYHTRKFARLAEARLPQNTVGYIDIACITLNYIIIVIMCIHIYIYIYMYTLLPSTPAELQREL